MNNSELETEEEKKKIGKSIFYLFYKSKTAFVTRKCKSIPVNPF